MEQKNYCTDMLVTVTASNTDKNPVNPNGDLLRMTNEYLDFAYLKTHKKQALLTIFTALSASVGEHITTFLSAQPGVDGLSLINSINKIIPGAFKRELSELNKGLLLGYPNLLKHKVVIALNPETVKKGGPLLKILAEQGHINDQTLNKTGGSTNINKICIEGPVSIIVLVGQIEPKWLNDFSAFRLALESSSEFILEQLTRRRTIPDPRREKIYVNVLKTEYERLKPQHVYIPFLEQIVGSLDHTNPDSIMIMDRIISFLNVVTIINNAKIATNEEARAGFYGIDINNFSEINPNLIEYHGTTKNGPAQPLVATKADYFIVYTLIAGAFNFNEDQISADAVQSFEAIKLINTSYIFGSTCLKPDKATERDIIKALDNQEDCRGWASILHIKETLEKMHGVKSYNSFVSRGVKELLEKKYISQKKDTNAPNKYLYAITTTTSVNKYDLPHPSEIIDPVYNGETIEVFNPLTGEMEYI